MLLLCGKGDKGQGCISLSLHLPLHCCSMQRSLRLLLDLVQAKPGRGREPHLSLPAIHTRLCRHLA